jgi:uncharacterized protein YbbC (DUF1343 family)
MIPLYRRSGFGKHLLILSLGILLLAGCSSRTISVVPVQPTEPDISRQPLEHVRSGLEVFLRDVNAFDRLHYGLMANQTSVNRQLVHSTLLLKDKIDLRLILSPEHGLFGAENAGDQVGAEQDPASGIPVRSAYHKNPDQIAEMIAGLDAVLFDIQDIGVRSYTYISSMAYLMQAAAKAGVKVIILDRPNPVTGTIMEGNLLNPEVASFVGMYPIPYRHGMTIGELALLFNTEYGIGCELEVVKMEGWHRDMWFDETGLPWVPTSPHVPDAETILPMIATGTYGELGMLSEGVGTTIPFELAGGPWIKDPQEFAENLQARVGRSVIFRPTFFKPYYGRHKGEVCGGVQIHVQDREAFRPYVTGLQILSVHQELYPEIDLFQNLNRWSMFGKVMGGDWIRSALQAHEDPLEMQSRWQADLEEFQELRKPYLLYD